MAKIGAVPLFVDAAAIVLAACAGAPSVQADAATVSNQPFQNQTVERLRCSSQGCRTVTIRSAAGVSKTVPGWGEPWYWLQTSVWADLKAEPHGASPSRPCRTVASNRQTTSIVRRAGRARTIVILSTHAQGAHMLPPLVACPCCHGDRTLTFYSLDGEPPQRSPCLHCEGRGEVEAGAHVEAPTAAQRLRTVNHPDRRKTARRPRARARSHKL